MIVDVIERTHHSRAVSWSEAHAQLWPLIEAVVVDHGPLPLIGTPRWLDLAPDDPRRIGMIWYAAEQWALHLENHDVAMIEASNSVSAAKDWAAEARLQLRLAQFHAKNPWAARQVNA